MGGREDLANLGIKDPYDVARVALNNSLPSLWIDFSTDDPEGYVVTLLHPNAQVTSVEQQVTRFGVWQHHSQEHALLAAQIYASNLARDQSLHTVPGLRSALFPMTVCSLLLGVKADWRARAKTMTPHPYKRADDIARAAWPHVLDPCVCSLGRIAQPHRGG